MKNLPLTLFYEQPPPELLSHLDLCSINETEIVALIQAVLSPFNRRRIFLRRIHRTCYWFAFLSRYHGFEHSMPSFPHFVCVCVWLKCVDIFICIRVRGRKIRNHCRLASLNLCCCCMHSPMHAEAILFLFVISRRLPM